MTAQHATFLASMALGAALALYWGATGIWALLRRRRRLPFDWWRECPELRQSSHVHVIEGRPRWR